MNKNYFKKCPNVPTFSNYHRIFSSVSLLECLLYSDPAVPPKIKDLPEKAVLEEYLVIIPCEATGDPRPSISWMKDGADHEYKDGQQRVWSTAICICNDIVLLPNKVYIYLVFHVTPSKLWGRFHKGT